MKLRMAMILVLLGMSFPAWADGKMFWREEVPPTIPYQRALILFQEGTQTLVLRFPHPNPVYPLILTGTGGHKTEILIYLAAQEKMLCDKRLPLRFAGPFKGKLNLLATFIEPANFFATNDLSLPYLCKFKGALKPADMAQDLDFTPAPNQADYREHIWRW